jgi:hypothetical protein
MSPCLCPNSELIIAPTSIPDNPLPSMSSLDQLPVCPNFTSSLPFLYCSLSFLFSPLRSSRPRPLLVLARTDNRTTNQSILPTYFPPLSEKDTHSQFNTGVFTNTPQYVAVVATGRRSSRFREWRGSSLDSVEEVDEKREELC